MSKDNTRRINLYIPIESESARLNISMTALITLDLIRHKEEKEAIKEISQVQLLLEQLKAVEK